MKTKFCTKCNIEKPRTKEYFPTNKKSKDGLGSWCRKCTNDSKAIWAKRNKKKCNEYLRKHYKKHPKTLRGYISQLMININYRCTNPKADNYKYYGGRGIKCLFTLDELYNYVTTNNIDPRGLDIHRIDNDGNYALDNIEFLTRKEHARLHKTKIKEMK